MTIVPNVENKMVFEKRQSLLEFLPNSALILGNNLLFTAAHLDSNFAKATENFAKLSGEIQHAEPSELFYQKSEFVADLKKRFLIEFGNQSLLTPHYTYEAQQTPQPSFNKKFDLLTNCLLYPSPSPRD